MLEKDKENSDSKLLAKSGRIFVGKVISDKMEKTVVVKVNRTFRHPFFNKPITRSKKYKVHDESSKAKVGDLIEFAECRPISKTKHMLLSRIIRSDV